MQYRNLGNAGIKVSAVALGGYTTFGDSIQDLGLARRIILAAYESGINFFDIADQYAYGESERMMGAVLLDLPRHTLVISSKVFWPMSEEINDRGLSRKHIIESVEKSLKRIGTDYLDIYFCHRYDPDTPLEEVVRAMDDLVHQGKVLYWGTSMWTGAQIVEAVGLAQRHNLYVPRVEQPGYSLMRRGRVEGEILPAVRRHGIGLTTFSALHGGLLTGKYDDGIPENSRAARMEGMRERINEETVGKVHRLKAVADTLGMTRAQLAIAWVLRQPEVSSVITGASSPEQVEGNARAADVALTEDILGQLDTLFPASQ